MRSQRDLLVKPELKKRIGTDMTQQRNDTTTRLTFVLRVPAQRQNLSDLFQTGVSTTCLERCEQKTIHSFEEFRKWVEERVLPARQNEKDM